MPYIIDGNNLIGCSGDISLHDPEAREKIIPLIRRFQESKKTKITVVFDGEPQAHPAKQHLGPKFAILFPRLGHSADDEIKRILTDYRQSHEVILVSSDRELKAFAKERGAKTMNSIEFYYMLKRTTYIHGKREEHQKRIDTAVPQSEVEQWLKIFDQ